MHYVNGCSLKDRGINMCECMWFYPCAVKGNRLHPVRVTLSVKETRGCVGLSPSVLLLSAGHFCWLGGRSHDLPLLKVGFTASLVKHISSNSTTNMCFWRLEKIYLNEENRFRKHRFLLQAAGLHHNSACEMVPVHKGKSMLRFTISEAANNPKRKKSSVVDEFASLFQDKQPTGTFSYTL